MKRVLLTGASGFIGQYLLEELIKILRFGLLSGKLER